MISVLIIDDDERVAITLGKQVRALGYDARVCVSAEMALLALAGHAVDVVLADVLMPGMSGFELVERMRAHGLDVPVVLFSGDSSVATAIEAQRVGAVRFLTKPISLDDLRDALSVAAPKEATDDMAR